MTPYMIEFEQAAPVPGGWSRFNEAEILTLKKMARATGLDLLHPDRPYHERIRVNRFLHIRAILVG